MIDISPRADLNLMYFCRDCALRKPTLSRRKPAHGCNIGTGFDIYVVAAGACVHKGAAISHRCHNRSIFDCAASLAFLSTANAVVRAVADRKTTFSLGSAWRVLVQHLTVRLYASNVISNVSFRPSRLPSNITGQRKRPQPPIQHRADRR